jgi:hypothetical protein
VLAGNIIAQARLDFLKILLNARKSITLWEGLGGIYTEKYTEVAKCPLALSETQAPSWDLPHD